MECKTLSSYTAVHILGNLSRNTHADSMNSYTARAMNSYTVRTMNSYTARAMLEYACFAHAVIFTVIHLNTLTT